jgi:hypothetical protein
LLAKDFLYAVIIMKREITIRMKDAIRGTKPAPGLSISPKG